MTRLKALLHTACWSITLFLAVPLSAEDRCTEGPAGPHDVDYLTACRPEPVSAQEKDAFVRTLPPDGALTTFTSAQRTKIDALTAVLRLHEREAVYDVRFIDVPQAWMGLHGRAVLLISVPALDMLGAGELQALVAHEIGHEYLLAGWEAASAAGDDARLQHVEAACDAIAALSLRALGLSTQPLASAITKVERYNLARFGVPLNASRYPGARERCRLLERFRSEKR